MEQIEQYIKILFISKIVESILLVILIGLVFYLVYLIKNENRLINQSLNSSYGLTETDFEEIPEKAPNKKTRKPFLNLLFKNTIEAYEVSTSTLLNELVEKVENCSPNFIVLSKRENKFIILLCYGKGKKIEQCLDALEIIGVEDVSLILATLDTLSKDKKIKLIIDFDFFKNGL